MKTMNDFSYRTLGIYTKDKEPFGFFVFYGDGTYIDKNKRVFFGIHNNIVSKVFDLKTINGAHIDDLFFNIMKTYYQVQEATTENQLKQAITNIYIKESDFYNHFGFGTSQKYMYPYDKLGRQVFNTVCNNNNLIDIDTFRGRG